MVFAAAFGPPFILVSLANGHPLAWTLRVASIGLPLLFLFAWIVSVVRVRRDPVVMNGHVPYLPWFGSSESDTDR